MRRLLVAILILTITAPAQTRRKPKATRPAASSTPASWPIESVTVHGNHLYSEEQVLAIAAIRPGQIAGKPEFDAAHARLMETGAFETVAYGYAPAPSGKGYAAKFDVVEITQVFPVAFEDLPLVDSEVRAWLKQKDSLFGPKIPATEPALNRYKQLVTEYLAARGYHEPISVQLALEISPDLSVLFRPAGTKPSVAQVRFTDTGEIKNEDLLLAMNPVAIGAVFTEPRFRQLLETTIRPLYEARGHLTVTFPKIATEPAKDVKGLVVTVQVEQGPVYKLGSVGFSGSRDAADDLKEFVKLKPGELANFDELKAAQARVDDSFRHRGYLKITSKIARTLHDAEKTVDVVFKLEPGPQFTLGKLDIVGLDITTEPELRKMWGLKPGKPFNPSYPNHFLDVVREQGLFDNLGATSAETKINPGPLTVDVTLYFKGSGAGERKRDREGRPRIP